MTIPTFGMRLSGKQLFAFGNTVTCRQVRQMADIFQSGAFGGSFAFLHEGKAGFGEMVESDVLSKVLLKGVMRIARKKVPIFFSFLENSWEFADITFSDADAAGIPVDAFYGDPLIRNNDGDPAETQRFIKSKRVCAVPSRAEDKF